MQSESKKRVGTLFGFWNRIENMLLKMKGLENYGSIILTKCLFYIPPFLYSIGKFFEMFKIYMFTFFLTKMGRTANS